MRRIINICFLIANWAVISFFLSIFYWSVFYLIPEKTYNEQIIFDIYFYFFISCLPILGLLLFNKKVRSLIFSKGTTKVLGFPLLFFFLLFYLSTAINTYQALFLEGVAKPHDYMEVPTFILLTALMILTGLFFLVKKLKRKII